MREHLFKGFRVLPEGENVTTVNNKRIRGKWIEGDFGHKCCISEDGRSPFWHVVPETVCEYTGQHDRNGKRIFENHICRFFDGEGGTSDYIIKWDASNCQYVTEPMDERFNDTDSLDNFFASRCEVVGDIFETKTSKEVQGE